MIKVRPITHIITGTAPVNPWPPTGSYLLCARLYTNTFLDHITVNAVSWNYGWGSSQTYADANCSQVLSNLSNWSYYTRNTVLQTTGQNEYGTYVDIFTDSSNESETAVDFSVILGNRQVHELTDDSWKITRVEVYKVGMTNGVYRVNNNPTIGQIFMDRNSWTEFPLSPSSRTKFRPYNIIETTPSSKVIKNYQTYLNNNRLCWIVPISEFQDGLSNNLNIDVRTISNNYLNSTLYVVNPGRTNIFYTYCQGTSTHEGTSWEFKVNNTNLNNHYSSIQSTIQEAISAGYNYIYLSFQWQNSVLSQTVADFITGYDASSKFRPLSVFEVQPDPVFPYQTVQIGNQIWMAENLHEDDGNSGIETVQSVIANGYEFGPQTYYTYEAAIRVANSIDGWHLPTLAEWQELQTYFDNRAANARSTTGWQSDGTNTLGLNIQPVGRFDNAVWRKLSAVGSEANLWCYNVDTPSQGKGIFFYYFGTNNWGTNWNNYKGNSVRLVKD